MVSILSGRLVTSSFRRRDGEDTLRSIASRHSFFLILFLFTRAMRILSTALQTSAREEKRRTKWAGKTECLLRH